MNNETILLKRLRNTQILHENEVPTLDKVLASVNSDRHSPLLKQKNSSLILRRFEFQNRNRLPFIIDRDCNVLWRRQYLRSASQFRSQERTFYCLDETWVNESHGTNRVCVDSAVKLKQKKRTFPFLLPR